MRLLSVLLIITFVLTPVQVLACPDEDLRGTPRFEFHNADNTALSAVYVRSSYFYTREMTTEMIARLIREEFSLPLVMSNKAFLGSGWDMLVPSGSQMKTVEGLGALSVRGQNFQLDVGLRNTFEAFGQHADESVLEMLYNISVKRMHDPATFEFYGTRDLSAEIIALGYEPAVPDILKIEANISKRNDQWIESTIELPAFHDLVVVRIFSREPVDNVVAINLDRNDNNVIAAAYDAVSRSFYFAIEEPGTYIIVKNEFAVSQQPPEPRTALPTTSTVIINGVVTAFEAYNIGGYNFFKLRDLAYAINGSDKQFSVEWDSAANAIFLVSGSTYTVVGGEMALGDGTAKIANPSTTKIFLDGQELNLTAYNIGGNNFFRLRDLMRALDIGVTWDGTAGTIDIDTFMPYLD
jgi:hypothetical protein